MRNLVARQLTGHVDNARDLPYCQYSFYDGLVFLDHRLSKTWIVSTGLLGEVSRSPSAARHKLKLWNKRLGKSVHHDPDETPSSLTGLNPNDLRISSNISRQTFMDLVRRAQQYIRSGDIYQGDLSQRLKADMGL